MSSQCCRGCGQSIRPGGSQQDITELAFGQRIVPAGHGKFVSTGAVLFIFVASVPLTLLLSS